MEPVERGNLETKGEGRMNRFLADEAGLETVEYAIIAGMIVAGLVAVVVAIGTWVKGEFDTLKTNVGA
jgi:Flp pilus assembly pilin Flp